MAEEIRLRWASFDTLAQLVPTAIIKVAVWLIVSIFIHACLRYSEGLEGAYILRSNNGLSKILHFIFGKGFKVSADPGIIAALLSVGLAVIWNAIGRINYHFKTMLIAAYVFITEHKRIIKIKWYKKLLYCLTWPVFDAIGRWTMYFALFMKVEWKPIPHTSTVTIHQIEKSKEEIVNGKQ